MIPAHIEPVGAKLEQAKKVTHAKEALDAARTNFDKTILQALEHGLSKAEIARRSGMTETAIYKRVKKLQAEQGTRKKKTYRHK
ncbi:MAG: AsnC family protein [Micrococcaceae bacterium]